MSILSPKEVSKTPLSYHQSGVDIDRGNAFVEKIKPFAQATRRPEVLNALGGFGAFFALPQGYKEPILVSGTDGVGTKLRLAIALNQHENIGVDLVAMCVNDVLVSGAQPLFFLDYYASSKLNLETATSVVKGIAHGCQQANCALIGGETAEMPGLYQANDYDLAGFCVGIVEKSRLIDGHLVQAGDAVIGLASSGPHANGFALINKILEKNPGALQSKLNDALLKDLLLEPTRIYVQSVHSLLAQNFSLHALAHITGGGLTENIPRVLPAHLSASIHLTAWNRLPVFDWIQEAGQIALTEMLRVFNCGIGMVLIVPAKEEADILAALATLGEKAYCIGHIQARQNHEAIVFE